jgi:HD superfamily phosphodiesterase
MTNNCFSEETFENQIKIITDRWLPGILEFLNNIYTNVWIPSHDIKHHQRVWQNAVKICKQVKLKNQINEVFYFELLISSFFHDTGLIYDRSESHGKESRRIAAEFISIHQAEINFDRDLILEAIEKHDDKNYEWHQPERNILLEVLSTADDIDALGATGLYRYIEIYLLRNIPVEKIPVLILANVDKRMNNLENCLLKFGISTAEISLKYNDLLNLLDKKAFKESPVSLVEWINQEIVIKMNLPDQVFNTLQNETINNLRIQKFLMLFKEENHIA